jgi:hypothetical protein
VCTFLFAAVFESIKATKQFEHDSGSDGSASAYNRLESRGWTTAFFFFERCSNHSYFFMLKLCAAGVWVP